MAQIRIDNLRKEFADFCAVESSTFTIEDGEFFMLLGPSGCGKTTTLRMMAGLEFPTNGKIYIDGEEVGMKPAFKRDIAFVFQMFALYPHMNVHQNIAYPLLSQGISRTETRKRVLEVADILAIKHLLYKPIGALSGGDKQRVALGRAIVRKPKAFFMDEPLGALDTEFREHMATELRTLHDRMRSTTVYVTHDQLEAMQMGDKIAVMNQGIVEQLGKPQEIYDWPASQFVASFIGSPAMNFLHFSGTVAPGDEHIFLAGHQVTIPALIEGATGSLLLGVRPEHIRFSHHSQYRGKVIATEYLGTTQIVTVKTNNGVIKMRVASSQTVTVEEHVGLQFDAQTLSIFQQDTGRALLSMGNKKVLGHG